MRRFLLTICLLLSVMHCGYAQDAQQQKKERLEKEISLLDSQLKQTQKKSDNALVSLKLLNTKISSRKKLLAESNRQIRTISDSIYLKQKQINRLQEKLDTLSLYYGKLVKNAYKNRDSRVWYMYILSSKNLSQGFHRYNYLKSLSSQMSGQAAKMKETKAELSVQRDKLYAMKKTAVTLKNERQKELDKLSGEEKEVKALVAKLEKNKKSYQKQLNAKRKEVDNLNREISRLIAANSSRKKSSAVDVKLSADFAANRGKLPWPVDGIVTDTFGEHFHPVYKRVKLPFNNGVGVSTEPGAKVKAVFDGTVKQVIVMPGYNKCVLIQHGEYFTFYCKLGTVNVKTGSKVTTGQVIGTVDTISGETQLHFQLWKEKSPQNPELWLKP